MIIGATSGMAEQCARLWLHNQAMELSLVGRDAAKLERIAADLRVRSPNSNIVAMVSDFLDPLKIQATVTSILEQGPVDIVLIAQGSLAEQNLCEDDLSACQDALEINGVSPVLFAESFAKAMAIVNKGTIALISSVAGDRGRKSNYVYGAAKGLVSRYAQGLQHRFAGTNVKIVLLKPGPTDTPMTAHLKAQGAKLASVEAVAKQMVAAIDKGQAEVYLPAKWRLIMLILHHMPRVIFNKLNI